MKLYIECEDANDDAYNEKDEDYHLIGIGDNSISTYGFDNSNRTRKVTKKKIDHVDLVNNRFQIPFSPIKSNRIVDSLETMNLPTSTLNRKSVVFSSAPRSPKPQTPAAAGSRYEIIRDCKGNIVDTTAACERSRIQEFSAAEKDTSIIIKERVNCPSMNRVMDNTHEVADIKPRLTYENLLMSETDRFENIPISAIGPGYYDIFAIERGKYGPPSHSTEFSDAPTGRGGGGEDADNEKKRLSSFTSAFLLSLPDGGEIPASLASSLRRHYRGPTSDYKKKTENNLDSNNQLPTMPPSPNHPFALSPSTSSPTLENIKGTIKWSNDSRWNSPIYKEEPYKKTSGSILSMNWDKIVYDSRKILPKFSNMKRDQGERYSDSANVDIDTENFPFPKETMAIASKNSPLRYSSAFRSKAPQGSPTIVPTSGTLGPNFNYPPSIIIRSPEKPSLSFLSQRNDKDKLVIQDNFPQQLKTFSDINCNGPVFPKGGEKGGRNTHVIEQTQKKMLKIYPRLAKKKFKIKTEHLKRQERK